MKDNLFLEHDQPDFSAISTGPLPFETFMLVQAKLQQQAIVHQ
ncbi:hypothetical protein [Chitinophaga tropicalis]|nr:hypothetical protein [Chitinophaga tropicalis]